MSLQSSLGYNNQNFKTDGRVVATENISDKQGVETCLTLFEGQTHIIAADSTQKEDFWFQAFS